MTSVSVPVFSFSVVMIVCSMVTVSSGSLICKDSTIDAITYVSDYDTYFFTSGGYYWYIKSKDFPPKDSDAKQLPPPFKIGQAAVYVDTQQGCPKPMTGAMFTAGNKEIWIYEFNGGKHRFARYDVLVNRWKNEISNFDDDMCTGQFDLEWEKNVPLDAMFAINYIYIFGVKSNIYAMVDCRGTCTPEPNGDQKFGERKNKKSITDFGINETINAIFTTSNTDIHVLGKKDYWHLTITVDSSDGKITATKDKTSKNIIKDLLKISNPGECLTPTNVPSDKHEDASNAVTHGSGEAPDVGPVNNTNGDNSEDNKKKDEKSSTAWIWIVIVVIIIVVIVVAILAIVLLGGGKKSSEAQKAPNPQSAKPSNIGQTNKASKSTIASKK